MWFKKKVQEEEKKPIAPIPPKDKNCSGCGMELDRSAEDRPNRTPPPERTTYRIGQAEFCKDCFKELKRILAAIGIRHEDLERCRNQSEEVS